MSYTLKEEEESIAFVPIGPKMRFKPEEDHEQEDDSQHSQQETPTSQMSDKEKKLFELRLKMNQSRKLNLEAVVREQQQMAIQPQKPMYVSKRKLREESQSLHVTAEVSEKLESKKKKKQENKNLDGWQSKTTEAFVKSHEKRVDKIPYSKEEYDLTKDKFDTDSLSYGKVDVSEQNKNRMVRELKETNEKKGMHHRNRDEAEGHVNYISLGNKKFNKTLARSYDKYTEEIKKNIERGTAL